VLASFNLSVTGSIRNIAAGTLIEAAVGETQAALQLAIQLFHSGSDSQGDCAACSPS
jgi:hypothetical protein